MNRNTKLATVGLAVAILVIAAVSALATNGHRDSVSAQDFANCSFDMIQTTLNTASDHLVRADIALAEKDLSEAMTNVTAAERLIADTRGDCGDSVLTGIALCEIYPHYCVPLAGGAPDFLAGQVETANLRLAPEQNGVVRGLNADGALFIGDPAAPVQILEFADFACPHCIEFRTGTIPLLVEQAVLTGKASFQFMPLAFVARDYSRDAALAMICAGEQGAAWELHDMLYDRMRLAGALVAFAPEGIQAAADDLGLDGAAVTACVQSGRYNDLLDHYRLTATDNGVHATPSVLVRYGDSGPWTVVADHSLSGLLAVIDAAP